MTLWCWAYVAVLSDSRGTSGPPSFVTRYRRKDLILFACTLPAHQQTCQGCLDDPKAYHICILHLQDRLEVQSSFRIAE